MDQNTDYWKNKSAFETLRCHKLSTAHRGYEMYYQTHLIDLLLVLQSVFSTFFFNPLPLVNKYIKSPLSALCINNFIFLKRFMANSN